MIASLKNKRNRLDYERQVQMQCIRPVLLGSHTNNTVLKEIRRQKKEDSSIRTDDEKMLWDQLREVEKLPSLQSRLWRYRQPVDKDHFMKWVRGVRALVFEYFNHCTSSCFNYVTQITIERFHFF